jgi:hypothetical protein
MFCDKLTYLVHFSSRTLSLKQFTNYYYNIMIIVVEDESCLGYSAVVSLKYTEVSEVHTATP